MQLLRYLVWALAKLVLPLRYRLHVHGIERLSDVEGPALILPNHPAYCDPLLVLMTVWPWLHPRPLLYENYFLNPLLAPFAKLLRAVLVPDLERASTRARQRAGEALAAVVAALKAGDNIILWPAGHIERDGWERLGGARAASDILQAVPDVQVVLVRTRGIWGSRFSFAFTGSRPPLMRRLAEGIGFLVSNLLVFAVALPHAPTTIQATCSSPSLIHDQSPSLATSDLFGLFSNNSKPGDWAQIEHPYAR